MPISKNRRKKQLKRKAPARRRPVSGKQKHDRIVYYGNNAIISCSNNLIDKGEDCNDERQ